MKNLLKGGVFHKIVKKRLRFWRSLMLHMISWRLLKRRKFDINRIAYQYKGYINHSTQRPHPFDIQLHFATPSFSAQYDLAFVRSVESIKSRSNAIHLSCMVSGGGRATPCHTGRLAWRLHGRMLPKKICTSISVH